MAMEDIDYRQQLAKTEPEAAKQYEQDTLAEKQVQIQEGAMALAVAHAILYALKQSRIHIP